MSRPALTRLRGDFELSCTAEFYFDRALRLIRRRKIAFDDPTKQIRQRPRRALRRRLGSRGDSSRGSTSLDPGEFISRSFCRDADFRPPASPAFQRLLHLYRAFRHSSHDRGTLYLCKNAHWSLGEGFLRILAKSRRPSGSFWVRTF